MGTSVHDTRANLPDRHQEHNFMSGSFVWTEGTHVAYSPSMTGPREDLSEGRFKYNGEEI